MCAESVRRACVRQVRTAEGDEGATAAAAEGDVGEYEEADYDEYDEDIDEEYAVYEALDWVDQCEGSTVAHTRSVCEDGSKRGGTRDVREPLEHSARARGMSRRAQTWRRAASATKAASRWAAGDPTPTEGLPTSVTRAPTAHTPTDSPRVTSFRSSRCAAARSLCRSLRSLQLWPGAVVEGGCVGDGQLTAH